jgi:UDP-N-acetylglucosamine--N-acetylmuramyl-(pentapeptide) pyrophosphoryl-undecaprenol N-acetylglucosamine transferase
VSAAAAIATPEGPLRLALAGGGTGGHLTPALQLLDRLIDTVQLESVLWFTTGRPVEDRVLDGWESRLPGVRCERVVLPLENRAHGAPSRSALLMRSPGAFLRARRALLEHRSQVLLGTGGYVCLPAALAARSMRARLLLLEVNASAGAATRWLSPLAHRVLHAFDASLPNGAPLLPKHRRTGPPLGRELEAGPARGAEREQLLAEYGLDPSRPLLWVTGGSQGAASLNGFVQDHAAELIEGGFAILHQVGPDRLGEAVQGLPAEVYAAREFVQPGLRPMRCARVALTRGGAATLAECAALRLPSVVVPYPHHTDDHQAKNALALYGGAEIVREGALGPRTAQRLLELGRDDAAHAHMAEACERALPWGGASRIASELVSAAVQRAPVPLSARA